MRIISFLVIMLAIGMNGMAQTTEGIVERNNNGVISSVKYPREDKIGAVPENAAMFFTNVLKVRNEDSFQLQHSSNAKYGMSFERYTQFYKGIEVDGGFYSFRYKDGRMLAACGNYVLTENLKTIPLITEEAAKSVFAKYMKDKISDIGNCHIKLVITEKPNSKDAVLVYKVFFETSSIPTSEIGFIDANTGDLIYTLPASICYSALGTFYTLYNNSTTKTARTEYVGGNTGYILYDTTRGNGIHTYKWTGNTPSEFNDANNIWTASELGNYQMALDVHWTLQQIYDVLKNEYGHYSFDGADAAINAYIISNNNAYFNSALNILLFGMGQYPCRPLASVDIIGHEFGHGLLFNTTYIGNVGYDRDAIHEGLGDIWGLLFEHHITPNADIWKTGEDVMIGYDCERDFAYPNNPNAHTKIANTYNYGLYNTGDEHVKGGIASRWFYLLVNGGSGKNEKDDTYTVYSVGLDLAEELFTQTVLNSSYLANCSTFVQVRQAFVDAANDMENPFLAMQVANAWYAVGVGSQPTQINLSGSSTICPNSTATYTINNLPSGYTINWTINNSDFTISPSGNQCIVAYTGSQGYGMATLTANVYYNSYLIKQYTKSIQIGFPELDELEFYNYYGEGNWIEGNAGNIVTVAGGGSPYYDQYECDIYRLNNNGTETLVKHMCRPTPYFEFGYPWEGWFVVYIRGINDCGYSEWSFGEIECEAPENNGPDNLEDNGCRIVYSPDGNCLFISWTDEAMQRSAVMQKDGKASTYEVQIWNETKKVKSVSSNQQETRVPLAGLPKGFYIAKVIRDGKNCATKFSLW